MASAPTGVRVPRTGDSLHRMHVTRPKSAKGRTRTTHQVFSQNVEEYSCSTSPPPPPAPRAPTARVPSSPRILQEDVPELLHHVAVRPPSASLNRYRVLPSIGATRNLENAAEEGLPRHIASMQLGSEARERHANSLYRAQVHTAGGGRHHTPQAKEVPSPVPMRSQEISPCITKMPELPSVPLNLLEPSDHEPRLLLAIRSHTGQRFERYFRPTDTIYVVLAVAEVKTGMSCKNCSVESMEVPRRSFPDLDLTLQECGIPNKSVLCIHQRGRD